jgi:hypothetical protein
MRAVANQTQQIPRRLPGRALGAACFLLAVIATVPGAGAVEASRRIHLAPVPVIAETNTQHESAPPPAPPVALLAKSMETASPEARTDFVWIALDEMFIAYDRELIELDAQLGDTPMAHPDARWMQATRAYAQRLRDIAEAMTPQTPVEVRVEVPGLLLLYVEDAVVEVSGPRIAEPDFMGQRIVERYCEIRECDMATTLEEPVEVREPVTVKAIWSFSSARGPVCLTNIGLEFQFKDIRDIGRKRSACIQVAEQLRELSQGLKRAADTGVFIDWEIMTIVSSGAGKAEQVVLNRRGEYLLLSLPSLGSSKTLQQIALPWVRARVLGRPHFQSFPHAERLLATLLPAG